MTIEYITEAMDLVTHIKPVTNPGVWYATCEGEVKPSSTAMMVLNFLHGHQKKVGLLFTESCDSKYHCAHEYAGAGEALEKYTGGIAVVHVKYPLIIFGEELPLGVSMMHELGHAKQFIDRPNSFYMLALIAGGFYKESQEFGAEHPSDRDTVAEKLTPPKSAFNQNPKPILQGASAQKRAKEGIENENLALHEIPICRELKKPYREKYS
jgi:hypothetical protein